MSTEQGRLARLDAAIYEVEKKFVGALMLVMGVVMFADVVHRVFSRAPGRLATMMAGLTGQPVDWLDRVVSPAVIGLFGLFIVYGAIRSRQATWPAPKVLLRSTLALIAATALVQGFVRLVPEGVVWAPYFSLCLLLWVGLIGASMATYSGRHLALEMGEKIWPESWRDRVRSISGVVAAGFAVLITVLGTMSWVDHLGIWMESPEANLIPSVDLPKWTVFWVVPYAFGIIALRYLGRASGLLPVKAPPSELDLVNNAEDPS